MKQVEENNNINILSYLKNIVDRNPAVAIQQGSFDQNIANAAKEKIVTKDDNGKVTLTLTDEAINEAISAGIDPASYKNILIKLSNKAILNNQPFQESVLNEYKIAAKPLEQLIAERNIQNLAKRYHNIKEELAMNDLLLLNPGKTSTETKIDENGQEITESVTQATTFVHALFEANASKEDIEFFFKKLSSVVLNQELVMNYLSLADSQGKTIIQLIEEKSLELRYLNLAQTIRDKFLYLSPSANNKNFANNDVDTHTNSINTSVDRSLARIALVFDQKLVQSKESSSINPREVEVTRNDLWNEKITTEITNLKNKLTDIITTDNNIDEFIRPTLIKNDNIEQERNKFKFHAQTTLRLIEGLEAGSYGNHFTISTNKEVTCGLTPKEIVAISFNSLQDKSNWHNSNNENQHFMEFIDHLYAAKRGYNIDQYGEDEWKTHGNEEDDNKCLGGAINEIVNGLRDHKLVEVKIVNADTMIGPMSVILPDILKNLANHSNEDKVLINIWLTNGIINPDLKDKIIKAAKENKEFSLQFNDSDIAMIGSQVIQKDNTEKLTKDLQEKYPNLFSENLTTSDYKQLIHNFTFNNDKGYVPYLEGLYHQNLKKFESLIQNELNSGVMENDTNSRQATKTRVLLDLLLSSQDQDFIEKTARLFQKHILLFKSEQKNPYLILAAETGSFAVLKNLIEAGADINAKDSRVGHEDWTALHFATKNGHTKIARTIISSWC